MESAINPRQSIFRGSGNDAFRPGVLATLEDSNAIVKIVNRGALPPGFDFAAGIGTGLGLVRSLVPKQGTGLSFLCQGNQVVTVLKLGAPVIDV